MRQLRYREALREAMLEEMERDERVFIIGEEVGYYQGAYKVTQGLLERFGERRVVDAPIAEAGFAGVAIGAPDLQVDEAVGVVDELRTVPERGDQPVGLLGRDPQP